MTPADLHLVPDNSSAWLPPNLEGIPESLRRHARWVLWKASPDGKKVPYGRLDQAIDATNPVTWSSFDEVVCAFRTHKLGADGIGIALGRANDDSTVAGVDIDGCRDKQTGVVEPWALAAIRALDSYTEVSPSGTGVKVFVLGTLADARVKQGKRAGFEIYDRQRYFTVTGHRLPGTPASVEPREAQLRALYAHICSNDLIEIIKLRGLYLRDGTDYVFVTCPWAREHGPDNTERDAALHVTKGRVDGFNCFHAHCQARKLPDVLKYFGLDRASVERPQVTLVCLADVQPEAVGWLWHPYIPVGKVTLFEGDPGVGKSWLALALATAISLGRGLPDAEPQEPATVLVLTAEDGLGDTVRPRLDAMGADLSRVFAVNGCLSFNEPGLAVLEELIERVKAAAVFIDPFVAYIGAKVNLHQANETREVLAALAAIAERQRCANVLIRHLTKGSRDKSIYRGIGSIDITAACRSVLLIGTDADDPQKRALVQVKSNLAAFGKPRGYTINNGCFEWIAGVSDLTAHRILAAESDTGPRADAVQFLREILADGPVSSVDVQKLAHGLGITDSTLRRAKYELRVKSVPVREKNRVKGWLLELPETGLPLETDEPRM